MIGPLLKLAGKKEVAEAVAIAALTALATKAVELLYERVKKALEDDKKEPKRKSKSKRAP